MESEKKSWELSDEEKEDIKKVYSNFKTEQREYFIKIMNFILSIVYEMVENKEISKYGEMIARRSKLKEEKENTFVNARIKSFKSAWENGIAEKELDDIFGIEIVTGAKFEYERIIEKLKTFMNIHNKDGKPKPVSKPNGYKAMHATMSVKKEFLYLVGIPIEEYDNVPVIEIQYKTYDVFLEAKYGRASHDKYKGKDEAEMKEKYEAGVIDDDEVSEMWVAEHGVMRLLSKIEAFEAEHPYVTENNKNKGETK